MKAPEQCPACGAEVPSGARACPECGSDETTGWSDRARYDSIGVADEEDFDYGEFVQREFGGSKPARKNQTLWIVVTAGLVLGFAWFFIARFF